MPWREKDLERLVLWAVVNGIEFDLFKCWTRNQEHRNAGEENK